MILTEYNREFVYFELSNVKVTILCLVSHLAKQKRKISSCL